MGNSCSSGQAHKDKDNMSQRSEESGSYQVRAAIPTEQQQTLMNHVSSHPGVLLQPSTAGQLSLQASSPTQSSPTKNSGRKPSLAKALKDSVSLSSPPANISPKWFDKLDGSIPKEVANLSENLQNFMLGRVNAAKVTTRTKKIVIYVCAADSQDCHVEKGTLHNQIYPEIRKHCREKGYELHIVDLHWKTLLEKQQDHEFPELCIGELTRQMEVAYVIPVLFLNNSLGTPLLPNTIESTDFTMAMDSAKSQSAQSILSKWYQLDSDSQPPCYRLQSISSRIPGFKETSVEDKEKALVEWSSEIDKILAILINIFPVELRDIYLTTVVEQEVHNTVFMSQELAKRCIWMNRVYTPAEKTPENPSPGDSELQRRLNILQKDLRDQLAEKHIVRISVKYLEGGLNVQHPDHSNYIEQVDLHLKKHLVEMINAIMEEHQAKFMLKPSYGIEGPIFEELNQQIGFCQKAAQCSINREKTLNEIKEYITTSSTSPLVLFGPGGCGKTTLLAKVAQCCSQWLPEAFLILRFIGISEQSSTIEQILSSITNQCSILTYGHKCFCMHNLETYKRVLPTLLVAISLQRPLIIILDGLDQVRAYSSKTIDWLPEKLPENIKIILSVSEKSPMYTHLNQKLNNGQFTNMPLMGEQEAKGILMSCVMQYSHSVNSKIQDCVLKAVQECTLPLYSKVLAWQTSWWADKEHDIVPKGHVDDQLKLMLEELETIIDVSQVEYALALISCSKHGITDSEMIDLLAFDEQFHSNNTYVSWAPACLVWSRLNKHLAPFLQWTLAGGVLGIKWRDNMLRHAVIARYEKTLKRGNQALLDYYKGKWWKSKRSDIVGRLVPQDTFLGKCYNRRKLDELPFHHYQIHSTIENSDYVNDIDWMYSKMCGSTCYQLLEDINMQANINNKFVKLFKDFIENYAAVLNYDGRQFYSHIFQYIEEKTRNKELTMEGADENLLKLYELSKDPPVLSFIPANGSCLDDLEVSCDSQPSFREKNYDLLIILPESNRFLVSLSTEAEEICVWDISRCKKIRTIKGVPHPMNLIPIDQYRCIVLCKRELMIFDLNKGCFLKKLKGVMNQKMPYYGLHDQNHLVALSRNRMYVNLMNLENGDCVTTFKAGEDRFLNSLLVSGNGRILVCGDETQKPFPLLVWNLQSRKLLYDFRIPYHDFITSLSAITYEGSYVCCVCHEIDEPNPNFIVVYDLLSGTPFKKWKPSCNTVSIEISSPSGCVISGLEDASILIWDLVTGNCRWSLSGHTAPVTMLKLDPTGFICLSADSENRDRSIRVWDINKGHMVSVYTPKTKITSCAINGNGQHIVLGLENLKNLLFLELRGPNTTRPLEDETYGDEENDGKTFELKESDIC
ncbi:hypothetical protein WA026_002362 [Henosepilachna vigintioctopunctata]|uniref:Uncharacterized protein n=1 Tax=Henosepilachna vigintioctopunctata TaxID=420089 RepID=A0AAW1TTB3_9CUCU